MWTAPEGLEALVQLFAGCGGHPVVPTSIMMALYFFRFVRYLDQHDQRRIATHFVAMAGLGCRPLVEKS